MLCFKSRWLVFIFAPLFFSCGIKNPPVKNQEQDSTQTPQVSLALGATRMLHYTSIYQAWVEDGTMKDTLNFVHIWYDKRQIIIQDTTNKKIPKFTLTVGEQLAQPNLELYKQLGGVDPQTAYELKTNEQGFNQLIVFKSENAIGIKDIKYKYSFTLLSNHGAKTYFSSRSAATAYETFARGRFKF